MSTVAAAAAAAADADARTPTPPPVLFVQTPTELQIAQREKSLTRMTGAFGTTLNSAILAGITRFFDVHAQHVTTPAGRARLAEAKYDALAHSFGCAETRLGDGHTVRGSAAPTLARGFKRLREEAEEAVRGAKRARARALAKEMSELLDEENVAEAVRQ